jgi:hypothetical protein
MQVQADVFPAFVAVAPADLEIALGDLVSAPPSPGAFQVAIARVVITGDRIIVAQDQGNGPTVVFSELIKPETYWKSYDIRTIDSYVETISGKKLAWRKDSACGCGSRLRSWNPYANIMNSTADPTE